MSRALLAELEELERNKPELLALDDARLVLDVPADDALPALEVPAPAPYMPPGAMPGTPMPPPGGSSAPLAAQLAAARL